MARPQRTTQLRGRGVARRGSRPRCRCTRCRRAAARCAACRVLGGKDGGSCRVSCSCGPGPLGGGRDVDGQEKGAEGPAASGSGGKRNHPWADWQARSSLKPSAVSNHTRSEEHTSELQSLMRISYAVFCLKKKKQNT